MMSRLLSMTPRPAPRATHRPAPRPGVATLMIAALGLWMAAPAPVRADEAQRVVPLAGQSNFRDLGGYATEDGHHVRWNMIYRSGELSGLSAQDYRTVDGLGLRTVVDLRDRGERTRNPTVWGAAPVRRFTSPKTASVIDAGSPLADPTLDATRAHGALVDFYRRMPTLYAPEYRVILHELVAGHAPLLLHCTAGKDRSGVAAALILSALGVPRATVIEDYQLTDRLLEPLARMPMTDALRHMRSLPPPVQQALMSADSDYIRAALDAVDARYGSVNGYLARELGVGPRQLRRLRALYLQ